MYPIQPVPKRYAWGSYHRLQAMFRLPEDATEHPGGTSALAEMWFSGHSGSPSLIDCGEAGRQPVPDAIRRAPELMVGSEGSRDFGPVLPYLFKVISARIPLSLQVHPVDFEARAGFNRENALGIPPQAPQRSFKDPLAKHEMVVALEPFRASIGFAPILLQLQVLRAVHHPLAARMAKALVARTFVMGRPPSTFARADAMMPISAVAWPDSRRRVFRAFHAAVTAPPDDAGDLRQALREALARVSSHRSKAVLKNAVLAADAFPGDLSVLGLLMMNPVVLEEGESVFIPTGTPHAYIHGTAAEIMTNSDNVLRAGMTPKHRDIPNLLHNLDCQPASPIDPSSTMFGTLALRDMVAYRPKVDEYMLVYGRVSHDAAAWPMVSRLVRRYGELVERYGPQRLALPQHGPRVLLCTDGAVRCISSDDDRRLRQGEALFIPAAEGQVSIQADGNAAAHGSFLLASTPF